MGALDGADPLEETRFDLSRKTHLEISKGPGIVARFTAED